MQLVVKVQREEIRPAVKILPRASRHLHPDTSAMQAMDVRCAAEGSIHATDAELRMGAAVVHAVARSTKGLESCAHPTRAARDGVVAATLAVTMRRGTALVCPFAAPVCSAAAFVQRH